MRSRPGSPSMAAAPSASTTAAAGATFWRKPRREVILCGGRDQFAATPEAFRRRPGGGIAAAGDRRRRRPAGGRREPAGPSRVLFPGRLEAADHALRPHRPRRAGPRRAALADRAGAASARPTISRPAGSSARARASAIPTSSSISCRWRSPMTARRWPGSTAFRPMSGRCARKAAARCGSPSPDPAEPPKIRFNYMSHPDDWTEMRACVRLTREIFAQTAFDPYRGREIPPGADCVSDEAIDAFVREHAESAYHPSCTCKMGAPADPLAVVDPRDPGHRRRGFARRRFLDHALDHQRQSQRADDHDRREGGRPDPRPRAAAGVERALLCRAGLGDAAAVTLGTGSGFFSTEQPMCWLIRTEGVFNGNMAGPRRENTAERGD